MLKAASTESEESGAGATVGSRATPLMGRNLAYTLGNDPTTINGREFSGHALDEMQNAGIYPSFVENTISTGGRVLQQGGNIKYYDPYNDMTAVTNHQGRVVTTFWGGKE